MIDIEIKQGERGFYLIVNNLELGDYYKSIGINCGGGRVYFQTEELANQQAEAERNPRIS